MQSGASDKGKRKGKSPDPKRREHAVAHSLKMKAAAKENPFDKFANARKKHEVINRRVKGEDRNVGRARAKAIDDRKKTLLVDFQKSKKSNAFTDRRFGVDDADMSLEDKMFQRFQKERVKKARKSSIYNLDSGDSSLTLTHKGQVLGEANADDRDAFSDDDDEGGSLNKEVVNSLHFGGFLEKKGAPALPKYDIYGPAPTEEERNQPKTRLDALQEIVMKSKLFKMQKKEAKEEQEGERESLDKAFEELLGESALDFRPTKRSRRGKDDELDDSACGQPDLYDRSLREMAYEAKVQPTDRTKSDEEIAVEARERLERLEEERIKRMKASYNEKTDKGSIKEDKRRSRKEEKNAKKGEESSSSAGKRVKKADRFGNTTDGSDEAECDSRKRKRLTDDDINDSFGATWAKKNLEQDEEEEEEEGLQDEDDFEIEESSDDDEGEYFDGDAAAADDDDDDEEEEEEEGDNGDDGDDDDNDNEGVEEDEEGEANLGNWKLRKLSKLLKSYGKGAIDVNEDMPHNVECPATMEQFDELLDRYVRSQADVEALIDRILVWNSVHLPGTQGKENRGHMHNFLDILLKHFVRVGDSLGDSSADSQQDVLRELDHLTRAIFKLSQDVADAAPQLYGRTLKIAHSQLLKRLRDYVHGNRSTCWPSLGRLLLIKLYGHVFSVSDYKHAVVLPAKLFLCQCLAQCAVTSPRDVLSGLLCISILLDFTAETGRYVPEVLTFLRSVCHLYCVDPCSTPPSSLGKVSPFSKTFDCKSLSWVREACRSGRADDVEPLPWLAFNVRSIADRDGGLAAGILFKTLALCQVVFERFKVSQALPEMMEPLVAALSSLRPADKPALPKRLQEVISTFSFTLSRAVEDCRESRAPLQWRKKVVEVLESKEPKYELNYSFKKDRDPDQERVKLKQLNRQLKRENKAAVRELRRDSNFLEREKRAEKMEADERRKTARHRNYYDLQDDAAAVNKQVRLSVARKEPLLKGGGSGQAKKAKVRR